MKNFTRADYLRTDSPDASDAIRRSGIRGIATAGLEFEYSSAPGSMVMSAYSISSSDNQTFRVLLMDAASLPSSAGTYPWSITDDSSSVVYIKNVAAEPQGFIMTIRYGAVTDGYSPPVQTIAPGQTIAVDLRKLRDGHMPDGYGRTLPLDATGGQVHWSARGRTRLPMIGRVEQLSLSSGISMTAACGEPCCGDMFAGGFVTPGGVFGFTGATTTFTASEQWQDCWGSLFTGSAPAVFTSSNPAAATCDSGGNATGVAPGTAIITATWHYFSNRPSGDPYTPQCFTEEGDTSAEAVCDIGFIRGSVVSPPIANDGNAVIAGQRFTFKVEVLRPNGDRVFDVDGTATFAISGGTGTGETVPSGINVVAGAGTADVTLKRVVNTGDTGRTFTTTLSFVTSSSTDSGTIKVWFDVLASREGLVGGNTACNHTITANDHFVALPSSGRCNTNVTVLHGNASENTTVLDAGPWFPHGSPTAGNPCVGPNDPYWTTTGVPRAESSPCSNGAGIDLADGTFANLGLTGNTRIQWRFR